MKTDVNAWEAFRLCVRAIAMGINDPKERKRIVKAAKSYHLYLFKNDNDFYTETLEYRYCYEIFFKPHLGDEFLIKLYTRQLINR
jgi:hypothetical protein